MSMRGRQLLILISAPDRASCSIVTHCHCVGAFDKGGGGVHHTHREPSDVSPAKDILHLLGRWLSSRGTSPILLQQNWFAECGRNQRVASTL